MKTYKHHHYPASRLIKYRGPSAQIDKTATVLHILSNQPGLTYTQIADLIWIRQGFGYSRSDLHRHLQQMCDRELLVRSDNYYYLPDDAVKYNMDQTMTVRQKMSDIGLSLDQVNFLSSGIIMAAEAAQAEDQDREWDPFQTTARSAVNWPDEADWDEDDDDSQDSYDAYVHADWDEDVISDETADNPLLDWFPDISMN